mgnify:CR=1 FL=1
MSEPDSNLPEEDLLEFLGGIDEVNEDSRDGDFSGFLASEDCLATEAALAAMGVTIERERNNFVRIHGVG